MSSSFSHSFVIITVVLFGLMIALGAIMAVAAVRNAAANRKMVENMKLQSRYMDNTELFYQKTIDMIDSLEEDIRNGSTDSQNDAYLARCDELLSYVHGGSSVSEAVIADKKALCEKTGIRFVDDIRRIPECDLIDEMDLVSIIGNVLDNAIEAASGSGDSDMFVSCSSQIDRNVWRFKVSNSKDPKVRLSGGLTKTTKVDKDNHGLGIRILKNAVGRYHGDIRFMDNGDEAVVDVKVVL